MQGRLTFGYHTLRVGHPTEKARNAGLLSTSLLLFHSKKTGGMQKNYFPASELIPDECRAPGESGAECLEQQ